MSEFPINFKKFPHLGKIIFGYLEFNDLKSCRVVSKSWYKFLDDERLLWVELLEKEYGQLKSDITLVEVQRGSQDSVKYISYDEEDEDSDEYNDIYLEGLANAFENHTPTEVAFDSWTRLKDAVKNGPSADIISLIPNIKMFYEFGDISQAKHITEFQQEYLNLFKLILKYDANIDISAYLRYAIQAENIDMVKFVVTKVDIYKKDEFEGQTYFTMVERTGNMELLQFFTSMISKDFADDSETLH